MFLPLTLNLAMHSYIITNAHFAPRFLPTYDYIFFDVAGFLKVVFLVGYILLLFTLCLPTIVTSPRMCFIIVKLRIIIHLKTKEHY